MTAAGEMLIKGILAALEGEGRINQGEEGLGQPEEKSGIKGSRPCERQKNGRSVPEDKLCEGFYEDVRKLC